MVIAPLATLFFLYFSFIKLLPDYLMTREELASDSGVIKSIYQNIETKKYVKSHTHKECLDIELKNRNYIIRLTDGSEKDEWLVINDKRNLNKTIEFRYLPHVFHDNILYNPSELVIDNKTILEFNDSKKSSFWIFIGLCLAGILFGFFSFLAIKTYINEFLAIDRETYKKGFGKLIKAWFKDWTDTWVNLLTWW